MWSNKRFPVVGVFPTLTHPLANGSIAGERQKVQSPEVVTLQGFVKLRG